MAVLHLIILVSSKWYVMSEFGGGDASWRLELNFLSLQQQIDYICHFLANAISQLKIVVIYHWIFSLVQGIFFMSSTTVEIVHQ